jgi:hypothetical protein
VTIILDVVSAVNGLYKLKQRMPTNVINAVKCFVLRTTYLKIIDVRRKVGIPFLEFTPADGKFEVLEYLNLLFWT